MTHDTPAPYVTVTLRDLNNQDSIPERTIVLDYPDWEIKIGRGTLSGADDLRPAQENAWFDSRVLSRNHANLRADPITKDIVIEDLGSMHGTHLAGRRLKVNHPETLWPGDLITLGANVTRGRNHFNALQVVMNWQWSVDSSAPPTKLPRSSLETMSCNTFSPDYSEAEHFEEPNSNIYYNDSEDGTNYEEDEAEPDGEDEFVQNEICQESIEIVIPPSRTFAVPESDVSDPDSYSSGEESSDAESPTSSPVGLSEETEDKDKTASTIPVLEVNKPQASPTSEQTRGTSVNHKPGDAVWLMDLSDEDDDVDVDDDDDDDDVGGLTQGDQGEPVVPTLLVTKPDYVQSSLPEGLESSSPLSQNAVGGSDRDEAVHTSCLCDIGTVKPSAEPFLAPPFIQDLQSDGADNLVSEEGRSSYAWAGHNSVLYEPVTGNFSQGTVRAPPITSNAPANPPSPVWPNDLNGNVWLPQFSSELQDQIPKGSVASQVDDSPKEGSAELSNRTLKRKAEQISSDATLQEQTVVAGSNSPNPANSISAVASDKAIDGAIDIHESNLQTSQLPGTEANDGTPLQNAELPPRKKIKRSKQRLNKSRGSSSSSLIKIAAATIAGMAIGTVGTIVGLASLPPDYFM